MFERNYWNKVGLAAATSLAAFGCSIGDSPEVEAPVVETYQTGGNNGESVVVAYPAAPNAVASSTFSVTVNGEPVFVEEDRRISYANFAFAGEVTVEVTLSENFNTYRLSPEAYNISSSTNGDKLTFTLDRPRHLALHQINGWESDFVNEKRLFIFANAIPQAADELGASQVVSAQAKGIDSTGATDVTSAIATEIDALSAAGGGVLVFEPGLYLVRHVFMKDDVTVYLEAGARIQASNVVPSEDGIIKFTDVDNARLMGPGSVDANGVYLRYSTSAGGYSVIRADRASNIVVQDVVLQDPASFAVWFRDSENITMYNTKQIDYDNRDLASNGGNDGIDPDATRHMLVESCFVYAGDDATAIKGISPTWPLIEDITFRNNVIFQSALGSGLGIGSEVESTKFQNITYENNDVLAARFAVDMGMRAPTSNPGDDPEISGVFYKNNRFGMTRGSYVFGGNARRDAMFKDVFFELNDFEGNNDNNPPKYETFDNAVMMDWDFDGVTVDGQLMDNINDFDTTGTGISGFTFANSAHTLVTVDTTANMVQEGGSADFVISRTGSTSSGLVVYFELRGTAKNGTDYSTLANNYEYLAPGQSSATVSIDSIADGQTEWVEQVVLTLTNDHGAGGYLIGADYNAMITIDDRPLGVFEVGELTVSQPNATTWFTQNLQGTFTNPIVVMGTPSTNGWHQSTMRVRNVTPTSFQYQIDEWDYHDGKHTNAETVAYLVVEAGTHDIGGLKWEASYVPGGVSSGWKTKNLIRSDFDGQQIVLAQVASTNEASAVTTRVRNVTSSSFDIVLEEQELDGPHVQETVGYVAISPGNGTSNGLDFVANKTGNSVTHNWYTVNFGQTLNNPLIFSEMSTYDGLDTTAMRHRNLTSTSVQVKCEEEASKDAELNHTTEVVRWLAIGQ